MFLAKDTAHQGRLRAIKLICSGPSGDDRLPTLIRGEVQALNALHHRHIVQIRHVYSFSAHGKGTTVGIVMQYCPRGDLDAYLVSHASGGLSDDLQLKIMRQMADALEFMHFKDYAHRDLKPSNILLDESLGVKIADFGLAKMAIRTNGFQAYMHTAIGTPIFVAPEVFHGHYTNAADMFATGLVFACITHPAKCMHDFPSQHMLPMSRRQTTVAEELIQDRLRGKHRKGCEILDIDRRAGNHSLIWPPLRKLINRLLKYDYRARPKADEVLATIKRGDSTTASQSSHGSAARFQW